MIILMNGPSIKTKINIFATSKSFYKIAYLVKQLIWSKLEKLIVHFSFFLIWENSKESYLKAIFFYLYEINV